MGLFSSKKKTYVNTTVQKIFEEEQIPNSIKTGVLKGLLNGGDQIVNYMLEDTVSSIGMRAATGTKWAKTNYEPGLPESNMKAVSNARSVVLSTLASRLGITLKADYYRFGPMNSLHYGFQTLVDNYRYLPTTNEIQSLSATTGFRVFLKNMVATYQRKTFDDAVQYGDTGAFEQWGPAPSSGYTPEFPYQTLQSFGQLTAQPLYEVSDTATNDYVTVTYQYQNGSGTLVNGQFVIPMTGIDLNTDYHQVRYARVSDGAIGFFTYRDGAGTYPAIDGVQRTNFGNTGTYYPWTYIRYADQDRSHPIFQNTKWYKDTMKWCSYIGVDFMTLASGINADPNVGDVEQAMLMFGVNPGAQTQVELEYLFEYMALLYLEGIAQAEVTDTFEDQFADYTRSPSYTQIIQDRKFATALVQNGVRKRRVMGTIGKVGFFTGEKVKEVTTLSYKKKNQAHEAGIDDNATVTTVCWRYRKQVTNDIYEEYQIYNPAMVYQVTSKKGHAAGPEDPELLIPVDQSIVEQMSFRKKEQLLTRSLHLVVNTKVVVKSKWYQSTIFKVILVIVVVVITIVTWGGTSAIAASMSAFLAGSATAIAVTVLTAIVKSIVVNYAVKLFVKEVGGELGMALAVVAMIYGGYQLATDGAWASNLMQASNSLTQASVAQQQEELASIFKDFTKATEQQNALWLNLNEAAEAQGLNGNNLGFTGLEFVGYRPVTVLGESSEDYYNRTIHAGNIGATALEATAYYHDTRLTLPSFQDTISGDFFNG